MDTNGPIEKALRTPMKRSALRKARQRIARGSKATAGRPLSAIYTRVFPLQDACSEPLWTAIPEARSALHSFASPSMFDVLMVLHSNRLRLFAKDGERMAFVSQTELTKAGFDERAQDLFGEDYPSFSLAGLLDVLTTLPRKVGRECDPQLLARRLAAAMGARPDGEEYEAPTPVLQIAEALAERFDTWLELRDGMAEAARIVDAVLASLGYDLPPTEFAVAAADVKNESYAPLGKATIAYDPLRPPISEDTPSAQFAGVVASYLPECGGIRDPKAAKSLQQRITTANGNGLSWLFGVGKNRLSELNSRELSEALGVVSDEDIARVAAFQDALQSLPPLRAFGDGVYASSRTTLQGIVDSLIANYAKRLLELVQALEEIGHKPASYPQELAEIDPDLIYTGLAYGQDYVRSLYDRQADEIQDCQTALSILTGEQAAKPGDYAAAVESMERFNAYLNRFARVLSELQNRVSDAVERGDLLDTSIPIPRWLANTSKLVEIGDPLLSPEAAYPLLEQELDEVVSARRQHFFSLSRDLELTERRVLEVYEARIHQSLDDASKRGRDNRQSANLQELAHRQLLQRVGGAVKRCGPALSELFAQKLVAAGVVPERGSARKALNAYLFSRGCVLYKHPLSTRRQRIVDLDLPALQRIDCLSLLAELSEAAAAAGDNRSALALEGASMAISLSALPDAVPRHLVLHPALESLENAEWLALDPSGSDHIPSSEVQKLFNAGYNSRINGLTWQLAREQFVERSEIRCFMGGNKAMFVPTPGSWTPPPQLDDSTLGAVLREAGVSDESGAGFDTVATAKAILSRARDLRQGESQHRHAMKLLSQLPHRWAVVTDFPDAPQYEGLIADKGQIANGWGTRRGYLIETPRHFETELLSAFLGAKVSPPTLMFERHLERTEEGLRETAKRVTANIPIQSLITTGEDWAPRHILGIDLGEAGIGVTLIRLSDSRETSDFVPIRRIRKLIRSVQHYRQRQQPRQSYRRAFSESLELAKQAAVGEVCNAIDNLVARFDAIPVFEHSVGQFERGGRAIQTVYESVMARYVYTSNNEAKNVIRKSHWYGATQWQFPGLYEIDPKQRQVDISAAKLRNPDSLFRQAIGSPGVTVNAAGTSQHCSQCDRNPFDLLNAAEKRKAKTDSEGTVTLGLPSGMTVLQLARPSVSRSRVSQARRRNERAPFEPVSNIEYNLDTKSGLSRLRRDIKISLRRPGLSVQDSGTSQGSYHCIFSDCGAVMHADVNASVNIARRWRNRIQRETELYDRFSELDNASRKAALESLGLHISD